MQTTLLEEQMTDLSKTARETHDLVVRNFFNYPWLAGDVIKAATHPDFHNHVDLNSATLLGDRLDDVDLTHRSTDVLLEVTFKDQPTPLLLMIEHSSTVDHEMLPKVIDKIRRLCLLQMRKTPERKRPRYPKVLVISNADEPWTAPSDSDRWFEGVDLLYGDERANRNRFRYDVLDLHGRDASYFAGLDVHAAVIAFLLVLHMGKHPAMLAEIDKFKHVFSEGRKGPNGPEIIGLLNYYLEVRYPHMDQETMDRVREATCTFDEELRTSWFGQRLEKAVEEARLKVEQEFAGERGQKIRREGHQEGHQEGRKEGRKEIRATLMAILGSKNVAVLPKSLPRILGCDDISTLGRWTREALALAPGERIFEPA
jgi:hypothetical protein